MGLFRVGRYRITIRKQHEIYGDSNVHWTETTRYELITRNVLDNKADRRQRNTTTVRETLLDVLCTAHFYRASYASAVLGVVILSVCPSVRPSVTRVLCD